MELALAALALAKEQGCHKLTERALAALVLVKDQTCHAAVEQLVVLVDSTFVNNLQCQKAAKHAAALAANCKGVGR